MSVNGGWCVFFRGHTLYIATGSDTCVHNTIRTEKNTNLVSVEYLCSVAPVVQLQDHLRHFLVAYSTNAYLPFISSYHFIII